MKGRGVAGEISCILQDISYSGNNYQALNLRGFDDILKQGTENTEIQVLGWFKMPASGSGETLSYYLYSYTDYFDTD